MYVLNICSYASLIILFCNLQLGDALQNYTQMSTELSLQQKLRDDAQLRVEELEETVLDKDQELQRLQSLVSKLQGEVIQLFFSQSRAYPFVCLCFMTVYVCSGLR